MTKRRTITMLLILFWSAVQPSDAFLPPLFQQRQPLSPSWMSVRDVASQEEFDEIVHNSGLSSLVVVDYSTSWCGPCKVIASTFDDLSEKYPDAVFLKVIGDYSPDASLLMKREKIRSVPVFHYFKKGKKVEEIRGANPQAIEEAITKHIH